jgi:hypothetical protein
MSRSTAVAPVRLAICPDAWIVFDHGDKVGIFSSEHTARRVADLIHMHGLIDVPNTPEGIET